MPGSFLIAVIDDEDSVRYSTAVLLKHTGHRAELYSGGAEFLAANLPADLGCILLDIRMPGMDGFSVMRALRERQGVPPVLVLTGHGDVSMAVEAMQLGAADFLEKPYPTDALLEAIERACSLPVQVGGRPLADPQAQKKVAALTNREREVLRGILRGQQNKVIAWELGLSIRTVEAYRAQLLIKLGVRGTAEAVRVAIAAGLTDQ